MKFSTRWDEDVSRKLGEDMIYIWRQGSQGSESKFEADNGLAGDIEMRDNRFLKRSICVGVEGYILHSTRDGDFLHKFLTSLCLHCKSERSVIPRSSLLSE